MDNINIASAKYIKDEYGDNKNCAIKATIDGQNSCVPLDPRNAEYKAILEWVAEGNKIEDAD
tara:strand:- start:567 stop:752 length:186 start_codon:yes stop_codon:yes gene_type:complete